MTGRYLMKAFPQALELFNEIAADMALSFSVPIEEAVARINQHWNGQEFLDARDLIFHEDAHYWAMIIYFDEVLDWSADANRSSWTIRTGPKPDSGYWTIGET
jgi:hypothetical protein